MTLFPSAFTRFSFGREHRVLGGQDAGGVGFLAVVEAHHSGVGDCEHVRAVVDVALVPGLVAGVEGALVVHPLPVEGERLAVPDPAVGREDRAAVREPREAAPRERHPVGALQRCADDPSRTGGDVEGRREVVEGAGSRPIIVALPVP